MKTSRIVLSAVLTAALLVLVASAAEAPTAGTKAPDFTLKSQEGKTVSLHDFKGKWVVLYFYPKDFTQGCTIEAHNFQADQDKYTKMNAAIVGVSVDTVDSHQQFCTKETLTFKLLADSDKTVTPTYGSLGSRGVASRNTFIIDPKGVIRKEFVGVNPTPHSEEVLAALTELQK